jgi:hypothetical protein
VTAALKVLVRAALVSAALLAANVHVQPAAAATPCWKTLLNDWYDGRIDQTYPRHCYTQALHHLPADVSTYSSARDDITRALQSAVAKSGGKLGPNALVPAEKPTSTTPSSTTSTTTTTTSSGSNDKGLTGLANKLNPGSATSLPLPLLVLGGLALILVAAGAAGLVAKRLQARRPPSV